MHGPVWQLILLPKCGHFGRAAFVVLQGHSCPFCFLAGPSPTGRATCGTKGEITIFFKKNSIGSPLWSFS
uniref:Uncharacterized protein n=1 Tax=Arundo donax TaxID=35708 RepID=A0A0A9DBI9_ARUDO